jgi:hypothetical protein
MLLIGRQTIHPVPLQNAVDRGSGDGDLMKATQIRGDSPGAKMVLLPQINNLSNYVA